MSTAPGLDQLCIDTLRTLSIDAVQKANSGHPGTPMGAAPAAYCLWQRFLRYDPNDVTWPNRDRFVLSVGHASALLYSLLFLCEVKAGGASNEGQGEGTGGLAVTLADLQSFRQAGSRCTGHPEYGWTSGVETTTGPLGQGVATSVGGRSGTIIAMRSFGISAPGPVAEAHFGFDAAHVVAAARQQLALHPAAG